MSRKTGATTTGTRPLVVALVLALLLLGAGPASARWGVGGSGSASAVTRDLGAPTGVTATCSTVLLPRGIDVSWTAPSPAVPGTTYDVARSADQGATWKTVTTTAATTVNDRPTAAGTYRYRVTARVGGWTQVAEADSGSRRLVAGLLCL